MPQNARFASISRLWGLIWFSVCLHYEAFRETFRQDGLVTLRNLQKIRDAALAKLFISTSSNFVAFEDTTIVPSLVQAASGVILELGPGAGNQIHNYDSPTVNYIYGVEPNPRFKDEIKVKLEKYDLRDKYKLIAAGIENSDVLRSEGITEGSLDTVLCIQVLCAVKDPQPVMKEIWKLLKPGGKFIFWEHGWSKDRLTTVAQVSYTDSFQQVDLVGLMCRKVLSNPAWSTFVGCHLTRNILEDILSAGDWENPSDIEEPVDPISCLPRIQGVLIKKS